MNEVDEHLLTLIDSGNPDAWHQFVDRFQRRLLAFASKRVSPSATAEDLVQETFLSFLSSRAGFRGQGELESFLFQILRRRIVDHYRKNGVDFEVPACNFAADSVGGALEEAASPEPSASWYLRQEELQASAFASLSVALMELASYLHAGERFKDLKIAEGIFFARRKNQELATALSISANEVAVIKRRLIDRLRVELATGSNQEAEIAGVEFSGTEFTEGSANPPTDLLSRVWEATRPSCPKRSTLGKFTLGILPPDWNDYVEFHVQTLGCSFCDANLEELTHGQEQNDADQFRDRLFQSTIGFLG